MTHQTLLQVSHASLIMNQQASMPSILMVTFSTHCTIKKQRRKRVSGHLNCIECRKTVRELHSDPRVPPIDEYPCLCGSCLEDAANERIEELQTELNEKNYRLESLEK